MTHTKKIATCMLSLSLMACNGMVTKTPNTDVNKAKVEMTEQNKTQPASVEVKNELQASDSMRNKVLALFDEEKFTELDRLALQYQDNNQRTRSGLWKLTLFHRSFDIGRYIKDENYWQYNFDKVNKWIAQTNSPTSHIIKAQLYRNYAWSFRGGRYAKYVPKEAWKPFKQNLAIANEYLNSHKDIASNSPQWYSEKLNTLTGLSRNTDELTQVFDEGTIKFPNYYQIYFNMMRYLSPKWHGSAYEIEKFANKAVDITKDSEGMGMYARIYWVASQAQYDETLFYNSDVVWRKMRQGIFDVLEKYPDQWNIQNFAYFSCLAGDKETTRKLMAQIKEPIIVDNLKDQRIYNECKNLDNNSVYTNLSNINNLFNELRSNYHQSLYK